MGRKSVMGRMRFWFCGLQELTFVVTMQEAEPDLARGKAGTFWVLLLRFAGKAGEKARTESLCSVRGCLSVAPTWLTMSSSAALVACICLANVTA